MMTGDLALLLLQLPATPRTQEGIMFEQLDVINQPSRYAATDMRCYLDALGAEPIFADNGLT